ncbi:hypothetical protein [Paenibacillus sp. HB172176]|uniref:hypothetical protein n=1 Tax=Paenibacillus sp. HB172176 TaxID=2493690 RepID=UPI00143B06DE|nr:hypothetical protein [Paenibacillus sp. HB172176]
MREDNATISLVLKAAGCLIFDIAVILAFFHWFSFFAILSPVKSILMLMVLLVGLIVFNAVIFPPRGWFQRVGIVSISSMITVAIAYAVLSNLVSILAISNSVVTYIVWELILLSAFIMALAAIHWFSQRIAQDLRLQEVEQNAKQSLRAQIMNIEASLFGKKGDEDLSQLRQSFKQLKDRLNASTPFGRITGNSAVLDIEQAVHGNLEYIHLQSKLEMTEASKNEMGRLMKETLDLIKNRELMAIK